MAEATEREGAEARMAEATVRCEARRRADDAFITCGHEAVEPTTRATRAS
jgi:hypothetical protein